MQDSLQCTTQTALRANNAKLFAMKKTLAEQVRAFITAKGDGYTPTKLAEEVARFQRDLPEGKRCKRQNIEQLLENDFRTVRYMTALAAAMGTTAETLAAGQFVPGQAAWDHNLTPAFASVTRRLYPVISTVQAGEWSEIIETFHPRDAEEWMESPKDLGNYGFILRVKGDSMTNLDGGKENFPAGISVHIRPEVDVEPGEFVVAKRVADNEATFKKLVRVDGELYLHAINPAWPKPYIKLEAGDKIVGKLKFAGWEY